VIAAFRTYVNCFNFLKEYLSLTSAVDADIIMITGASTIKASAKATPYAARLNLGSANRAINADKNGPSTDIINQVAPRGSQNRNIFLKLSCKKSFDNGYLIESSITKVFEV
jgi:hypothetical protein